jgi:inner membrane protein
VDPVAHTLFGATLAESGLRRRSRYATATLIVGANLPDVDALARFWDRDVELHVRRGWTHGVLAMVLLPLLLAGMVALWHRWRGSAMTQPPAPAYNPRAILALSYLSVWSHPALDWINTYGVRLLMPFDGRWFYGDALFIVDPWFWLLTAAGVVLARSGNRAAIAGWVGLALLATWIVLGADGVSSGVKAGWIVGLLLLAALRWARPAWALEGGASKAGIATLVLYIGMAYGLARLAESAALQRFPAAAQVQANPTPGVPFAHRMVVVEENRYRVITKDGTVHELPRRAPDAIVQRALASASIRGFVQWMRFPYWTVEEKPDRWVVRIWDLRYQGPGTHNPGGIGYAQVEVPRQGAGN